MQDRRTTTPTDPRAREATRRERTERAEGRAARRAASSGGAEERAETLRRREVVVQGMRISLPALRFLDDKAAPGR